MLYQFFIVNSYRGQSFHSVYIGFGINFLTYSLWHHILGILLLLSILQSLIIFSSKWVAAVILLMGFVWHLSFMDKTCVRILATFLSLLIKLEDKRLCGCLIIYFVFWFIWVLYWCLDVVIVAMLKRLTYLWGIDSAC